MPSRTVRRFEARLEKADTQGLGWTVARLPFVPGDAWPQMIRLRVCGSVNGVPFRTSLFPDPDRPGAFVLLVTRATQHAAQVALGSLVTIDIEPDLQPRPADLPEELDALLDEAEGLRDWYSALGEYTRREIGKWVQVAKSGQARLRRAQQMAERLLSTMEAEIELPPAIMKALASSACAVAGWENMTETQRRSELLAVFSYLGPDARAKRIAKLCDTAAMRG
ncbi:MAG: YdeI/OmpD-associated family protein [Janthinobacterium lividum]